MTAALYRFRAELRRRRAAWIGVGIVVGLAGGLVLSLFAGARRTETAYDRFLEAQDSYDLLLLSGVPGVFDFAPLDLDAIAKRPEVTDSAQLHVVPYAGRTPDGRLFTVQAFNLAVDPSGRFGIELNRFKVLSGRLADPTQRREIVVGFTTAERLSLSVGDTVRVNIFDEVETAAVFSGQASMDQLADAEPLEELEVVGVVAVPGQFPPPADPTVDIEFAYFSPELLKAHPDAPAVRAMVVRLAGGSDAVGPFLAGLQGETGELPVESDGAATQAASVRRALASLSGALLLAGALAAIVATLVLVQILARQASVEATDTRTLDALGFAHSDHRQLRLLKATVIGLTGACVAGMAAVALSPLFPIGLARTAEPHPGVDVDVPIVLGGAVIVLLLCAVVAVLTAWISARTALMADRWPGAPARPRRTAAVTRWASAASPGPVVRAATTLTSGQRGLGGAIAGMSLGLVTVIGMLTFSASLDHLRTTPALYGWTWDLLVGGDFGEPLRPEGIEPLAADPEVQGMEVGALLDVEVAGRPANALAVEPVAGNVHPAILTGREPERPDEIALGPDFAPELAIGDRTSVALGDRSVSVELVGRGPLPSVDVLLDFRAARQLSPDTTPQIALIDLRPGTDSDAFAQKAADAFGLRPDSITHPELPQDVANFGRADATPNVIGGLMGFVAAATLLHALLTAVQSGRRTLAQLRALGFTTGQLLSTVAWQAVFLVSLSLVIALPLGVAAGRWIWLGFADQLGVVPRAVIPLPALGVSAAVALLGALLVAGFPGWRASRVAPAVVLRGD